MLKFPVPKRILTLRSSKIIPLECTMVFGPEAWPSDIIQAAEERIKVVIHPEHLKQTIAIGSTLTKEGRKALCDLLMRSLDIFAWKPVDMIGVPRHIAKHGLNMRKGCSPVIQKKRSQEPEINKAIQEEVEKPMDADIMKEVHYHRYHQINMAKEDEEKTAFITSQGVFCYFKMPFDLKNAEATYQRLVDKAFQKQISTNLEVYVDDMVIKSHTEHEIIRDIEETFKPLREINMKQHPKKCTFGIEEGTFLGYKVNTDGIMICPDKVGAVSNLPFLKCLKDVQKLNGKLATLNRFLSKSAATPLPFFKTLKKCTKNSDFQWTIETEVAFKEIKKLITKLPTLTAPMEKEELIIYLAAAWEAVSVVLMTKREEKQMSVYFVNRALQGEYDIQYIPRTSVKGQILVDFIMERLEDDSLDVPKETKEELLDPWMMFMDGSSCIDGCGASLTLTKPEGAEFTYALRFRFDATNNEAEYEGLIAGLRIAEQMGVKNLQANVDSRLVANQEDRKPWMIPIYNYLTEETLLAEKKRQELFDVSREEAVIPAEIGMPTIRTADVDMVQNDEALKINLDLLEEIREQAAIRKAKSKEKMEKFYNSKVCNTSFKPRDLVYRNNEASHA
nr:reverse transcriptase domain-containing protein [Tanacetum cinerariifolium]